MKTDYSNEYTAYSRENLMQEIQTRVSEQRFKHMLGAKEIAVALAKRYGASPEKASIAALTHDYAKERPDEEFKMVVVRDGSDPELLNYNNAIWHGLAGASFVERELGITDSGILHTIRVHTTGTAKTSLLDKIIYVANYIESGRDFPGVQDARTIAWADLNEAVAFETKHTLSHPLTQEQQIYPKTIETYDYWVVKEQATQYQEEIIIDNKEQLEIAVKVADSKWAEDIIASNVRSVSLLADYFMTYSANSERQISAITEEIIDKEGENKYEVKCIEGEEDGKWALIDLGDPIVCVFHAPERSFYNLGKLWSDAPLVDPNKWLDQHGL